MDTMNELLEKYFRAETCLAEENRLKEYFLNGVVAPEHEVYRPFFDAFEQEREAKAEPLNFKFTTGQSVVKRYWIQSIYFSGAAAVVLLLLWFSKPQLPDDYAIIRGKRIDNTEYVQKYAEAKMNKANGLLAKSMKPLHNIEKVKAGLQPLQKMSKIKGAFKKNNSN